MLEDKIKLLPTNPGVYIMKDENNSVIYVGKAKNLKNRVRQYFFNNVKTDKVMAMVLNVADFEYIITKTEIDALSLENNLIKKYKPKYNILLKDDKTYPYLKINLKEDFPTFSVTRTLKKDGSKYFGPFMGGVSVKDVLEIVLSAFSLRPCNIKINPEKPIKPCLNYHIKKCGAPCAGFTDRRTYMENVAKAIDFLNGNDKDTENLLRQKMLAAAENQEFELAMSYRDKIAGLNKIWLKRLTNLNNFINADVLAYKTDNIHSAINLLIVRGGRMLGAKNFAFNEASLSPADAITEFICRYYGKDNEIPAELIVSEDVDSTLLENYLKDGYGASVSVVCPKQGARRSLCDMAEENAADYLSKNIEKIKHKKDMTVTACERLKEVLNLSNYPKRMECYDISHISGVDKVGSMVVFTDGVADKNEYRRFKIKTVEGNNDFASLQEVLKRRLSKLGTSEQDKFPKPDLIVIDGGKGQLSSVKEIFDELGITGIDLISLAKREEEIFTLYDKQSVRLEKSDYCLRMLQRLRDEAHRFAITFNRNLRGKRSLSSLLDEINGIGKVKKQLLMEKFGDIKGIMAAEERDFLTVSGIGEKQAKEIYEYFHKTIV